MKTRFRVCVLVAMLVLSAGILPSQGHSLDDQIHVIDNGKVIVEIEPTPRIDCGEPGDDPTLGTLRSAAYNAAPSEYVIVSDSRTWRQDNLFRRMLLRQLFRMWLRQIL